MLFDELVDSLLSLEIEQKTRNQRFMRVAGGKNSHMQVSLTSSFSSSGVLFGSYSIGLPIKVLE